MEIKKGQRLSDVRCHRDASGKTYFIHGRTPRKKKNGSSSKRFSVVETQRKGKKSDPLPQLLGTTVPVDDLFKLPLSFPTPRVAPITNETDFFYLLFQSDVHIYMKMKIGKKCKKEEFMTIHNSKRNT